MRKTRDLFKEIRATKGTWHAKMGSIKDKNGRDLTEAEDIKNSWQEYTEELNKKNLHDPDKYDGVITHLEPDILECEVKWALGTITMNKASGSDGIPVELFQILNEDAVKVLYSICQQIWKTQWWPEDWKMSVFIQIPEKGNAKECSNNCTIALLVLIYLITGNLCILIIFLQFLLPLTPLPPVITNLSTLLSLFI